MGQLTTTAIVGIVLHKEGGESPRIPIVLPRGDRRSVQLCPPVYSPVTLWWTGRVRSHIPLRVTCIAELGVAFNVHGPIANGAEVPESTKGGEVRVVEHGECVS